MAAWVFYGIIVIAVAFVTAMLMACLKAASDADDRMGADDE